MVGTELLLLGTGLAAGVAHVFSGPDHLAAVLPFAVASRKRALRVGVQWGLGHGLGVAVLGAVAIGVRQWVDVDLVSRWAEVAVGVLLVFVGLQAVRASRLLTIHDHPHDHGGHVHAHPHVHFSEPAEHTGDHAAGKAPRHPRHPHSAFVIGALHGLAGTAHLVTILPAVASELGPAALYLVSYLAGAVIAMAIFALGAKVLVRSDRHVPVALRLAGATAMVVGVFWLYTAALA